MSEFKKVPLKIQGKKTKLLGIIKENLPEEFGTFYDVFMGSGVVGMNLKRGRAIFADINPHMIRFYNALKDGGLQPEEVRSYLNGLSEPLKAWGAVKYIEVRDRFNLEKSPLDFFFLNKACFNGVMRFNKKGRFNTPFCAEPDLLTPEFIERQIATLEATRAELGNCEFYHRDFEHTILMAKEGDLLYLDPPYLGLERGYFNGWTEENEERLFNALTQTPAKFMLSNWLHNGVIRNPAIDKYWAKFRMVTTSHRYAVGPKGENRRKVTEALFMNY